MSTRPHLIWPLPALLVWGACWGVFYGLVAFGVPLITAVASAMGLGTTSAFWPTSRWRRVALAAGFPLSLAASGFAGSLPPWLWLLPLALLLVLYPLNAWRDAPLFPTPSGALAGLANEVEITHEMRILDAGCGMGDALVELHREYPAAQLDGIEWSWPLRAVSALRCRFAHVCRADMWSANWAPYAMVYLFQRPESTGRAAAKATHELRPGAWLASLEFEVASLRPTHVHACSDGRRLFMYRAPFEPKAAPRRRA